MVLIKINKHKRAQSTIEFLVLMTIVLGAFLSIQIYFKRGVQGRWKANVDNLGDQYDPRVANTDVLHQTLSSTITTITTQPIVGGVYTNRVDVVDSSETKTGFLSVNY